MIDHMTCMLCGVKKSFPDGFPDVIYAECWKCCWDRHNREKHPPKKRWKFRWPIVREIYNGR